MDKVNKFFLVPSGDVEQVVTLLLGAYAEVDSRDNERRTPLHYCSETGCTAVMKVSPSRLGTDLVIPAARTSATMIERKYTIYHDVTIARYPSVLIIFFSRS